MSNINDRIKDWWNDNKEKYKNTIIGLLIDKLITIGGTLMWKWILKTLSAVLKKAVTSDVAKAKVKELWTRYDDFESYWNAFCVWVNQL